MPASLFRPAGVLRKFYRCEPRVLCALIFSAAIVALAQDSPNSTSRRPGDTTTTPTTISASSSVVYTTTRPSADGTGKVYLGREIAQVMGHLGAEWLERPDREREERPRKAVEMMELRPGDVVADIGAGSGYFSFRMAALVPKGKVLAVDIQPEMLAMIEAAKIEKNVINITTVLGKLDDPMLPEGAVDIVLMVDAYHEFDHPYEMMRAVVKALKPGGRVIDLEYRAEDPDVAIKPHHKMTQAQAIKEMAAVGLQHVKTRDDLPQQHFMVFQKPVPR